MTNIRPISDMRNYTEVLNEVAVNQPVFLTRNGRGAYAILDLQHYDMLLNRINQLEQKAVYSEEYDMASCQGVDIDNCLEDNCPPIDEETFNRMMAYNTPPAEEPSDEFTPE